MHPVAKTERGEKATPQDDDSLYQPSENQLSISRQALSCYRQKKGWIRSVDPIGFIQDHPVFAHRFRQERRAPFWGRPVSLVVFLAAALLCTMWLASGSWRIKTFITGLFQKEQETSGTNISEYPVPLGEREIPPGVREPIKKINESLASNKWSEAVAQAVALRANSNDYALLKSSPRALEWIFEVLVAGRVVQQSQTDDNLRAAIEDFNGYKAESSAGQPSFRLQYNVLNARFQLAGDAKAIGSGAVSRDAQDLNEEILKEVMAIPDRFGTDISKDHPERVEKLRIIRAFTLARLLAPVPKEQLVGDNNTSGEPAKHWEELYNLLSEWNQQFTEESKWSKEFVLCSEWFWKRAHDFAYFWWFGDHEVKIGQHTYHEKASWAAYQEFAFKLTAQAQKRK